MATGDKELMQNYIDGIYNSFDNNRANFKLQDFIETTPGIEMDDFDYAAQSIPYVGLRKNDRREIKCIIKDNGHPYIPGSTLKGAIKGALLYDFMKFAPAGISSLDRLMKKLLKVFRQCERELSDLERIAGKRSVSWDDKKTIRDIKKQIGQNGGEDLARQFDQAIEELMTKDFKYLPKDFAHLKPSDTSLFPIDDLMLQLTKRLHYMKGQVAIPANLEAIKPKAAQRFKLTIIPQFYKTELAYLNEEQPIEGLFKRINKFSQDNVSVELDLLDDYPWADRVRGQDRETFLNYQDFLNEMYNRIEATLPHEAYMAIGFGKSFYYNSIGILVNDWDRDMELGERDLSAFRKYCKLFFLGKDGQKNFPLTRTVTNGGVPMGWVKMVWEQ